MSSRDPRGSGRAAGPKSAFIRALADLSIAKGVHAHSIIGVKKPPIEEGSDGVVSYRSAQLHDVESERVVKSGHSSQSSRVVVYEVRRIPLEHLADAEARGIVTFQDEPRTTNAQAGDR